MNTYLRILSFGKPWNTYIPLYLIFTLLYVIFSVFNLALLIPLLDVLFSQIAPSEIGSQPEFYFNVNYFKDLFNFYFNTVVIKYGKIGALQFVCAVIIGTTFFANLFRYLVAIILIRVKANVIRNLRRDVYQALTRLDLSYYSDVRKGDLVSRVTNDVQMVESTVADSLKILLREPILIIGQFVLLFYISPSLTLYTLLLIPIAGSIIGIIVKKLKSKAIESQKSLGVITSILDETLSGIRLIKAFTARTYMNNRFIKEINNYARITISLHKKFDLAGPVSEFFGVVVVAIILLIGGTAVLQNNSELTASEFLTFIIIFARVLQPSKSVANAYSMINKGLVSGDRVFEIIDSDSHIKDKPDAREAPAIKNSISFNGVNFSYENNTPILKNINLVIEKGKMLALVGPSGAGKSTLADLIPRFFDPVNGEVQLDGTNIRDFQVESLRKQMGIVTQESILFNDSIINNIAFGVEHPEMEDVVNAAKVANAHDFIMDLPEQYETVIGDQGTKLSGGQRQRLSIARAVLKNPPILILDEATSSLDTESEKLVQEALFKLMKNRTSIVIAHRLSTIQNADVIIVMENGEVVESGTHTQLLEAKGLYTKLSTMQNG